MTCRHCGGRSLIQALLIKGDKEVRGLIPDDIMDMPRPRIVRLDGESGWLVDMVWTTHTYWEEDLRLHGKFDLLRRILNVELEEGILTPKEAARKLILSGCYTMPKILDHLRVTYSESSIRYAVWNLIDHGEVILTADRRLEAKG